MTEDFIKEAAVRGETVEIIASYRDDAIIDAGFDEPFRRQLLETYEAFAKKESKRDCILSLEATVAGSPVDKAIFKLYQVVNAKSGILICANYPPNYVRGLTDLGLPSLRGFELCSTTEEAREKMLKLRTKPTA